jgi:hypothetical protein
MNIISYKISPFGRNDNKMNCDTVSKSGMTIDMVNFRSINPLFADFSLDLQVIVLKVLAVPVELKSVHSTVSP